MVISPAPGGHHASIGHRNQQLIRDRSDKAVVPYIRTVFYIAELNWVHSSGAQAASSACRASPAQHSAKWCPRIATVTVDDVDPTQGGLQKIRTRGCAEPRRSFVSLIVQNF